MRTERDSMGEMQVPDEAYYGASTARAVRNFPISGQGMPRPFIQALGLIKAAAAATNAELGLLDQKIAAAVTQAAFELAGGRWDKEMVVDVFQTGSGTSTNMNANEVIANRATELLGGARGSRLVHPNDHVNMGQSSNDVFPTALYLSALSILDSRLIPALRLLADTLTAKAAEFDTVVKIGRTHLQDATPVRLGQEFQGYATMAAQAADRLEQGKEYLCDLALGGTAVGTGINTHPEFAARTIARMADETKLPLREASNHFAAQGAVDGAVAVSGLVRTAAVSLMKIANDIRWLASGPRCGIGEINLPAVQPGSSIMPGKVNPVIAESLIMVCAQVQGNDLVVGLGGQWGFFELNTMLPVIGWNLLESIRLLANAARNLAQQSVAGITANAARCEGLVEQSLAMVTVLAPVIGYDRAAQIAKHAYETGKTVREILLAEQVLPPAEVDRLLQPLPMTEPGIQHGTGAGG
ncbi:MAG: class II fumarate hydratase [Mycobacterium leprae]